MLMLSCLEFSDHKVLDYKISEFVNNNLSEILQVALDLHSDQMALSDDVQTALLESISPSVMMRTSPKKCEDTLFELNELINSPGPRFSIKPQYEYFLYQCIDFYCEFLEGETDFLMRTMPEPLRSEALDVYGESVVSCVETIPDYLHICFDDWDFLSDNLSEMVALYLNNSPYAGAMISVEELDEFVELMDVDQREVYLKWRQKGAATEIINSLGTNKRSLYHNVIKALLSIQRNKFFYDAEENELNDALKSCLGMVYDTFDQTRQGVSETGNSSGSVDLLICQDSFPIAITEALKLNSVNKSSIQRHINKLLVNYDPNGLPYAFLIAYYTEKAFSTFCTSFEEYIRQYSYPYPVAEGLTVLGCDYAELFQAAITLHRNGKPITLFFIAAHIPNK